MGFKMKYKNIEDAEAIIRAIELVYQKPIDRKEFTVDNIAEKFNESYKYLHKHDEYFLRKDIKWFFGEKDFSKLLYKWAFFPDIAIQTSVEEAFGIIMGVRDTKSWAGNRYFLWRPSTGDCLDICNSSPKIYAIDMPMPYNYNDFQKKAFNEYLNAYCLYKKHYIEKTGKIVSFGKSSITILDASGNKDDVEEIDIENTILKLSDEVGDLSFSITISSN